MSQGQTACLNESEGKLGLIKPHRTTDRFDSVVATQTSATKQGGDAHRNAQTKRQSLALNCAVPTTTELKMKLIFIALIGTMVYLSFLCI